LDARHFDALARRLSTRRIALGGVLAGLLLPLEVAARGKGNGKNAKHRAQKSRGTGNQQKHKGHDKRKEKDKKGRDKPGKDQQRTSAQAEVCWRAGACSPKKGSNVSQCNLAGYSPATTLDCTGCNISRANLRGANLSGANLTKANLSGACLIDANLTGAIIANNTNMYNTVICRTRMPDGNLSDAGCGFGSPCCPVCDATHPCPAGQLCCDGRCVTGNCCTSEACANPNPACVNFTCSPCTSNGQCGSGKVCCDGQCKTGNCCTSSDCTTPTAPVCVNNTCNRCSGDSPCPNDCCHESTGTCGACVAPQTCGGGIHANVCGCTPTTCAALGKDCASFPDGCGGTLNCGTCPPSKACGGGNPGTPGVCVACGPDSVGDSCTPPEGVPVPAENTDKAICRADGKCCVSRGQFAGGKAGAYCLSGNCCSDACLINDALCL
jgi:hypothetical protein